jgi:TPR repeat protein
MERAHELGEALGAYDLAQWYEHGNKLLPNFPAAVRYLQRAAELGEPLASLRLQLAFSGGELGLSQDQVMAQKYQDLFIAQTA